ncbi:MAG: phosphonopyruvate decarboxylase [Culturomica sp.]|jgi:phosphonopyruvate decarboxylase|nr:phosphonopyruvate decarboxylase [Culturomica sp.]
MISVEKFYQLLSENGIEFFTGVPDSLLKDICAYITDNTPAEKNIIAANEGAAVGLACGYHIATGLTPLVYMQNSGIGNAVNPLVSLADEKVYNIPLFLMIGWRGEPGKHDEPQHVKQGEITLDLLHTIGVPYVVLEENEAEAFEQMRRLFAEIGNTGRTHAIVVRDKTFSPYKLNAKQPNNNYLSREDALKLVVDNIAEDEIIVSTTGKLSRELYEYRDEKKRPHSGDFLTVGSMGHSSSIALGIALEKKDRTVFCLDGDGAFLMHLGAITNIGMFSPANFKHIVFNNGVHESVGGQPTAGFKINIPAIASACGYSGAMTATTASEIEEGMRQLRAAKGAYLLEIKVGIASRSDLGRPKTTPVKNKIELMKKLK